MKLNAYAAITAILIILSLNSASALSLIADCQYEEYRYNQSDAVFTAEVLGYEEVVKKLDFKSSSHTLVELQVQSTQKGEVPETVTLYQQGAIDAGEAIIPGMTLEWKKGDVYTFNVQESENGYQLVCAGMGRELISTEQDIVVEPLNCRNIPSIAINPETQERVEFNSECNVPRGWTLVTRMAQPERNCSTSSVIAISPNGDRQQFHTECDVPRGWSVSVKAVEASQPLVPEVTLDKNCIQIIAYAMNPETGEVQEFPTPCDVPKGWEEVQENPVPISEPTEEEPKGIFAKITLWFSNLF